MLKQLRQNIVQSLWEKYRDGSSQIQQVEAQLKNKGINKLALDHFAIIDLPGPHSGIPYLKQIFTALGFSEQGKDYLAEKQNDFLWLAEDDSLEQNASDVLPQVVVADFRPEEMPIEISNIIAKYARQARPAPLAEIQALIQCLNAGDNSAIIQLTTLLEQYFAGRDWPLPSTREFHSVREFNELLAWVLIFGRRPNHFTLSVHLLEHFANLDEFHRFIEDDVQLPLNQEGGVLKGGPAVGIAQGSTAGISQIITLADGNIEIPTGFVEFVWRFPIDPAYAQPVLWKDYFTGFVASQANRVIESLYIADLLPTT